MILLLIYVTSYCFILVCVWLVGLHSINYPFFVTFIKQNWFFSCNTILHVGGPGGTECNSVKSFRSHASHQPGPITITTCSCRCRIPQKQACVVTFVIVWASYPLIHLRLQPKFKAYK